MGTLGGHVLPGVCFLCLGLLWTLLSIWMQLTSKVSNPKKNKKEGNNTTSSFLEYKRDHRLARKSWIPLPCCPRAPLEPVLKVFFALIGIMVEGFLDYRKSHLVTVVYNVVMPNGELNNMAKLHHITMYGAFLISGIVDIVSLFLKLPRQASQIVFSMAFWVEWMLFYSHSSEGDSMNTSFHFLLNLAILSCVIVSALRVFYSSHFLVNIGLSFCIMLQGTWFIQVGVSLYPQSGSNVFLKTISTHAHRVTMLVYALFTWHVLLLTVFFFVLFGIVSCCARNRIDRRLIPLGLSHSQDFFDSEEKERLISVDDGKKLDVAIEMEEVHVTETVS